MKMILVKNGCKRSDPGVGFCQHNRSGNRVFLAPVGRRVFLGPRGSGDPAGPLFFCDHGLKGDLMFREAEDASAARAPKSRGELVCHMYPPDPRSCRRVVVAE